MWKSYLSHLKENLRKLWVSCCKNPKMYINHLHYTDVGWGTKVQRRRGTGTGRMRTLKDIPRRAKNNFRSGTVPKPKTRKTTK